MIEIVVISKKHGRKVILVDDFDFDWLSKYKWGVIKKDRSFCARTFIKQKTLYIHRLIMGVTDPKLVVDHIDRNPLNNQRRNLRVCTVQQNSCNRTAKHNSRSKYLGVGITAQGIPYAAITKNGIQTRLGSFKYEEEAALAYNEAATELHGEFAALNVIDGDYSTIRDIRDRIRITKSRPELFQSLIESEIF